jgi:hypothetical protein
MSDRIALARAIAARTKPRFIEIPRERGGGKVPFTEEQLKQIRGGLTAEEYCWKALKQNPASKSSMAKNARAMPAANTIISSPEQRVF